MTRRQEELLARLRRDGGQFLRGADVRVARVLERMGLVTVEDNGVLRPGGLSDGERWFVKAKAGSR